MSAKIPGRELNRRGLALPVPWRHFDNQAFAFAPSHGHQVLAKQFDVGLISTCVVVLHLCEDLNMRDENTVKMIQLKALHSVEEIIQILDTDYAPNTLYDDPDYRLVTISQAALRHEKKWDRFIRAPKVYWQIMNSPKMVPLSQQAEVRRGLTTGANDFFYFRDSDDWEERGISPDLVRPPLKHVAETEQVLLQAADTEWWVLDIHRFVETTLPDPSPTEDLVPQIKESLENAGHQGLLNYIALAESDGLAARPTLQSRRVWFDLGSLPSPPLALSEVYWRTCPTLVNPDGVVIDKRLYGVWPTTGVDLLALGGVLNSSLYRLMRELHGRVEQGQGMNRNTLMVYEAQSLPVPDIGAMSEADIKAICEAFEALLGRNLEGKTLDELLGIHYELDLAVMTSLGLADLTDELQEAVKVLLTAREVGAGQHTEVLVKTKRHEEIPLMGARRLAGEADDEQLSLFDNIG